MFFGNPRHLPSPKHAQTPGSERDAKDLYFFPFFFPFSDFSSVQSFLLEVPACEQVISGGEAIKRRASPGFPPASEPKWPFDLC